MEEFCEDFAKNKESESKWGKSNDVVWVSEMWLRWESELFVRGATVVCFRKTTTKQTGSKPVVVSKTDVRWLKS